MLYTLHCTLVFGGIRYAVDLYADGVESGPSLTRLCIAVVVAEVGVGKERCMGTRREVREGKVRGRAYPPVHVCETVGVLLFQPFFVVESLHFS
jgi:hypothetical protein